MKNQENRPEEAGHLRRQAEELARKDAGSHLETPETLSPDEIRQALHELRVHQIELEAILAQDEAGSSAEHRGPDERRKSLRRVIRIVLSDISERKQAEEVLRESEAKHKSMIGNISDVIAIMAGNGTLQYKSPNIEKWFGWRPEDLLGTSGLKTVHPDDLERIRNEFRMLLGKDNAKKTVEYRYQCKDGSYKWIELTALNLTHDPIIHGVLMNYHDITERKQRENELRAIATLTSVLRTASVRAKMLPLIAEQLVSLLQCHAISVEMIDPFTNETIVEAAYGVWEPRIGCRQPANTGLIALILETRRSYCICNNDFSDISQLVSPGFFSAGICAIAGAPLIAQDQLIGVLWMGRDKEISESEVRLLEAVSDIAANSVQRATLLERTQKFAVDLVQAYDTTLEGWAQALELRDHETEGHARNVVELTVELARALGFDEDELKHIRRGALLHDIGKMGIPDSILLKPGTLNENEWEIMRRHPQYAYQLLEPIE